MRSFLLPLVPACLFTALFAACSSSTTPAADDAGAEAAAAATNEAGTLPDGATDKDSAAPPGDASSDFCAAAAARATKCGDSPPKDCAAQKSCYENAFRPGVAAGLEACITGRECKTSDDPCFENAAAPFKDEPAFVAYSAACTDKRSQCAAADAGSFADDYCAIQIALLPNAALADFQGCLQLACGDVTACFKQKVTAIGCGK